MCQSLASMGQGRGGKVRDEQPLGKQWNSEESEDASPKLLFYVACIISIRAVCHREGTTNYLRVR